MCYTIWSPCREQFYACIGNQAVRPLRRGHGEVELLDRLCRFVEYLGKDKRTTAHTGGKLSL